MNSFAYTFERLLQPIFMVLIVSDLQSLAATVPLAPRVFFVRANLGDPISFDHDFKTAVLSATDTACLLPRCHFILRSVPP